MDNKRISLIIFFILSISSCSSSDCTNCTSTNDQGLPIDNTICVDEFGHVTVTDNIQNDFVVYTDDTDYDTFIQFLKNLGQECN